MNRNDLRRLMQVRDYPAVSILCPTHRSHPDNRQDPIQLKALVREAVDRLRSEFEPREIQPIVDRLESLAASVDFDQNLDGLALYVSRDVEEVVRMPFRPEPRVIVDETFATRDLVHALNRAVRYRVLVIGPRPTRLFEGVHEELQEVTRNGFPVVASLEPARSSDAWWGVKPDAILDEIRRRFLREVDRLLAPIHEADPLPLVVVGVEHWITLFREVTRLGREVIATVPGSFATASSAELARKVAPLVQDWRRSERTRMLEALDRAVSANRYASGIDQVWRAAKEGRGETLLLEEGYRLPARLGPDGLTLERVEDPTAPDVVDDIVDELIETVLSSGGRVLFYPPGALEAHQRVALILRY
ncbi:MAG TPA: hypothetical protein VIL13_10805 [Longimicrobiales bacterium]